MKLAQKFTHIGIYLVYIGVGIAVFYSFGQLRGYLLQTTPGSVKGARPSMIPFASARPNMPLSFRGSIPYWDQKAAVDSFFRHRDVLGSISLFWYHLASDSTLAKYIAAEEDRSIIDSAHREKVKVSMVVTNLPDERGSTWDSGRVEKVLTKPELRQKYIDGIVQKIADLGFDGVTIDYEEVEANLRDEFSFFIREMSTTLHQQGYFVGVALHPKTGGSLDKLYRFQDWKALSTYADELYIMAYGEHWDEGSPGPIASSQWVEKIVEYAREQALPLEKFYLGLPLYGYDWEEGSDDKATGLTYQDVRRLMDKYKIASEWGEDTPAPFFRYEEDERGHEVWFENAASVEEKIKLAQSAGFGGVTFWRLGGEDPEVWERVRRMTTPIATPAKPEPSAEPSSQVVPITKP